MHLCSLPLIGAGLIGLLLGYLLACGTLPILERSNYREARAMDVKPGVWTTEFWLVLVAKIFTGLVAGGFMLQAQADDIASKLAAVIGGVAALIALWELGRSYVTGRTQIKVEAMRQQPKQQITPQAVAHEPGPRRGMPRWEIPLALLLLCLLPLTAAAQSQSSQACWLLPWRNYQEQRLRDLERRQIPAPQNDALLQQLIANQQRIIDLLVQRQQPLTPQQQGQPYVIPQAQPQILLVPPAQPPLQIIPLGQPPYQQIPLGQPPQQQIPLGQPPQQQIPLGQPPQQQIPPGGPPQQQIPLQQPSPAPQPQIPLGQPPNQVAPQPAPGEAKPAPAQPGTVKPIGIQQFTPALWPVRR